MSGVAPAVRPKPAKDRFSTVVYGVVAVVAVAEVFALFWLDLI